MSRRAIPLPAIDNDRLDAMLIALFSHRYVGEIAGCEPLTKAMAGEIFDTLRAHAEYFGQLRNPVRPSRAKPSDLHAAAVARLLQSRWFRLSQEDSVRAAFAIPLDDDEKIDSRVRTYRNLAKLLPQRAAELPPSAAVLNDAVQAKAWLEAKRVANKPKRKAK